MARTGWVGAVAGFVCLGAAALGASRSVIASPVGFFVVVILVLTGGVSLVLVGPPGAGKSTVGPLVASSLGLRFVDADEASIPYYEAAGWSLARFAGLIEFAGYERAHLAWEEALAYAAPRLLSDYPDAVIALGAGHTHVTTPARQAIIRRALHGRTVVLLRPAQDLAASVAELRSRCLAGKGRDWIRDGVDWLDRWSRDGLDDHLANQTVYTMGRSLTQVASDVELAITIASARNTPPPTFVVDADYHQINLYNGIGPGPDMAEGDFGPLLVVGPTWLIVQTGVAMGWVRVTVSLEEPPGLGTTPTPGWEMTEEVSIAVDGDLWLTSFDGERRFPLISDLISGFARIRVSSRGRALNYDAYIWTDGPEDPKEDYLVEIWQEEAPRQTVVVGDDEPWSIVSRPREEPADPGQ